MREWEAIVQERQGQIERLLEDVRRLTEALAAAEAEVVRTEEALREIRDMCRQVCAAFEFCSHPSCKASYTAWAIADAALARPAPAPEGS